MINLKVLLASFMLIILSLISQGISISNVDNALDNDNEYYVVIKSDLKVSEEYISFIGKVNHKRVKCYYYFNETLTKDKIMIYLEEGYIKYNYKYKIEISNIEEITNKYNNPSSFDYEKYMLSKRVKYNVEIADIKEINKTVSFLGSIKNLRLKLILNNIKRYPEMSEYINALVFGYKDINEDVYQAYINLSLVHIFAISGTHVFIIVFISRYILSLFKIKSSNIDIIVVVIISTYTVFGGMSPSVIRAALMIIANILLKNKLSTFNTLMYIFLLNLIINPFSLLNSGFQLTYIITFILIVFSDLFSSVENKLLRSLLIQFMINIYILPIVNNMNYSVNIFSYLLNIVIVPVVVFVLLPLSLLLTVIDIVIFVDIYGVSVKMIEYTCLKFDSYTYYVGCIHIFFKIIYVYILMVIMLKYVHIKIFDLKLIKYIVILNIVVLLNINIMGSVNIVDVNQGDGIVIKFPYNKGTFVIDLGKENATQEMIDYLKYSGINEVDALFITHMHDDHYGDINTFINSFYVDNIYVSEYNDDIQSENVIKLSQGDTVAFKGYEFEIIAPFNSDDNLNNQSLVMKTRLGNKDWLFMGDAEADVEEQILNSYSSDYLDIDYLKAGHHGSKTSSTQEFIDATSPTDVYISVGLNNMYNHPSDEVIERYEKENIKVHLTMEDGLIKVYFI